MPIRPLKPCKHRGCGALVADGKTHCDRHAHEAVKWKPDAVRGNRHARGYPAPCSIPTLEQSLRQAAKHVTFRLVSNLALH